MYDKESKIQEVIAQKKTLEKAFRDKERELDAAYHEADFNLKV